MVKNSPLHKMNTISDRLKSVRKCIERAAADKSKAIDMPKKVSLLAISKTKSINDIKKAVASGQTDFGENYLQEAIEKISHLQELNLTWHYVGAIQSNKTKDIAEHFSWVHGLSKLKHAKRLSRQRPQSFEKLNVCIQINIDEEESKNGVMPNLDILLPLAKDVASLDNISLRGLMVIPSVNNNKAAMRDAFRRTRLLFKEIKQSAKLNDHFDTLSMGMSSDMELAIQEGATIVRVGTAIFGPRN